MPIHIGTIPFRLSTNKSLKCKSFSWCTFGAQLFFRVSTLCISLQHFADRHIDRLHSNNKLFRNISLLEISGGPERTAFLFVGFPLSLHLWNIFHFPYWQNVIHLTSPQINHYMSNVKWQPLSKSRINSCHIHRQPHKDVPFFALSPPCVPESVPTLDMILCSKLLMTDCGEVPTH